MIIGRKTAPLQGVSENLAIVFPFTGRRRPPIPHTADRSHQAQSHPLTYSPPSLPRPRPARRRL